MLSAHAPHPGGEGADGPQSSAGSDALGHMFIL